MLTNYYTLAYVADTLRLRLLKRTICEGFTQEKDQLVLRFEDTDEALIVSCDRVFNTLFLRQDFARARANSVNILSGLVGATINAVTMHPVDRVVMFELAGGKRLDAQFFGARANVILLDENEIVLDAFKDAKKFIGTKPEYREGEIVFDIDALRARVASPQLSTLAAILKEMFPTLGSTLVKEIVHRAQISGTTGAMSIGEEEMLAIQRALSSVLADLSKPLPRIFMNEHQEKSTPVAFSIIPLLHSDAARCETFDDVHEAIRVFVSRFRMRASIDEEVRALAGKLNQKLQKARRTVDAVEADVRKNNRADEYQHCGDLIMSNLHQVQRAVESFTLDDQDVTIPLSKELSPAQNAQKYFERAKRLRVAQQQAQARLSELQEAIAPLDTLLRLINTVETKEDLKQFVSENEKALEQFGLGRKSEQREQLPFRIFTVDGGFEVWAGKSSKNNDELTMKYAKPNDLWFHARGSAGSHVVLKVNTGKGEPGKRAKEQAASIAAYYSKMKNAKMVPVAMTEKKYVRKPKGAAPGSVAVEREKVIFAEPELPQPERS